MHSDSTTAATWCARGAPMCDDGDCDNGVIAQHVDFIECEVSL